jgi:predicted amidohydrolase
MIQPQTKFRAAAVQESSVWMDRAGSTEKVIALLRQAAHGGANIIAFPESFVPGFPYWVFSLPLNQSMNWHLMLQDQAVDMDGPEVAAIAKTCRELGVVAVVGVTEREAGRLGTLYNTNIVFGADGTILGKHRKLIPTVSEKQAWAGGDGSTLSVFPTQYGGLGTLCCGENINTLARFALLDMGERIHVANFPSVALLGGEFSDDTEFVLSVAPHAYEGKLFSIGVMEFGTPDVAARLGIPFPEKSYNCVSGIMGPTGTWVSEPLRGKPGIVYGDCDMAATLPLRLIHEITGHYNKFDVLRLEVDRRPRQAVRYITE